MQLNIPVDLTVETNRAVFNYIRNLSVHPEIAEVLVTSVKPLGDAQIFSPDKKDYRSVGVSTKGIIFGFATGANTIKFRLDDLMRERALATGANAFNECGLNWVSFEPFRCDWPKVDFEFWALKAYTYVRESSEGVI